MSKELLERKVYELEQNLKLYEIAFDLICEWATSGHIKAGDFLRKEYLELAGKRMRGGF